MIGAFLENTFGLVFAFRWTGAALAAALMALPLMVRAIRLSIESIDQRLEGAAATLGASPLRVFATVTLPLAAPGMLAGTILTYVKALGEFGATITFVSNIPGQTQTLSLAIYSLLQTPEGDAAALRLILLSIVLALAALLASELLARRLTRRVAGNHDRNLRQTVPSKLHARCDIKLGHGITALFGASGAGKSSLLNLIAGLEQPDSGRIRIGSESLYDSKAKINLAVHKRRIGYVFQDALLLPHLSVRNNLRYGIRQGGMEFSSIVDFLGISALLERRPSTLSGGERQRVSIGRALLSAPRLVLMDEPLASLDMDRKREIFPYIEQLQKKFGIPVIFVSHAIEEVARLAQHVIVMRDGKAVAQGSAQAVMNLPDSHTSRFEKTSILTGKPTSYDSAYGLTTLAIPPEIFPSPANSPMARHPFALS